MRQHRLALNLITSIKTWSRVGLLACGLVLCGWGQMDAAEKTLVYFGTYTSGPGKGIYRYELDPQTGALKPAGEPAEANNASFLAIDPAHLRLFAVSEVSSVDGKKSGAVAAYTIDPATGELTYLNRQSSVGTGPCHVSLDKEGKFVLVANYGGGSVATIPVKADGSLGEGGDSVQHVGSSVHKGRQTEPHAHSINLDAENRYAFAADLGLDKVLVYRFNRETGDLEPNEPPAGVVAPGSGPRHFAFHPSGKFAYVCNELTSGVTAFAYDAQRGTLTELQTLSTLPMEVKGNSTAEIQVHPSGKFLYVSNRGHNSIASFTIDPESGKLTVAGHQSTEGKTPRNFGIDPTGTFMLVANQDTNNVVVFKIDPATGALKPTGNQVEVPKPVCVKFLQLK